MEAGSRVLNLPLYLAATGRAYKRIRRLLLTRRRRQVIISIRVSDSQGHRNGHIIYLPITWLVGTHSKTNGPPTVQCGPSMNLPSILWTIQARNTLAITRNGSELRLSRASSPSSCPPIAQSVVAHCETKGSGSGNWHSSLTSPCRNGDHL